MFTPSLQRADRPNNRIRRAAAGLGLCLVVGLLAVAGPADARTSDTGDRVTRPVDTADRQRPDMNHHDRMPPHRRDLEVLRMKCGVADGGPEDTRIHIGCRWRAAEHEGTVGYQLWRIVDRGERELVARGGLDLTGSRDVVSAEASVVRYAVIAVDEDGRRVAQSRVQRIVLDDRDRDDDKRRARRQVDNKR